MELQAPPAVPNIESRRILLGWIPVLSSTLRTRKGTRASVPPGGDTLRLAVENLCTTGSRWEAQQRPPPPLDPVGRQPPEQLIAKVPRARPPCWMNDVVPEGVPTHGIWPPNQHAHPDQLPHRPIDHRSAQVQLRGEVTYRKGNPFGAVELPWPQDLLAYRGQHVARRSRDPETCHSVLENVRYAGEPGDSQRPRRVPLPTTKMPMIGLLGEPSPPPPSIPLGCHAWVISYIHASPQGGLRPPPPDRSPTLAPRAAATGSRFPWSGETGYYPDPGWHRQRAGNVPHPWASMGNHRNSSADDGSARDSFPLGKTPRLSGFSEKGETASTPAASTFFL